MSRAKRSLGRKFWISLFVGVGLTTLLVAGCSRYSTPEERADAVLEHVAWELDLDSAQQESARQVADVVLKMRYALRGQDGDRHQVLFDLLTAENFDAAGAQSLYEQSRQELDLYVPQLIHAYSVFHAGLMPEQRQELSERLAWLHDHHHH